VILLGNLLNLGHRPHAGRKLDGPATPSADA
jgi:hypothetical protein